MSDKALESVEFYQAELANARDDRTALRAEIERLRADNERLRAAIAYVRKRSDYACTVLNEFDNTRRAMENKPSVEAPEMCWHTENKP